MKRVVILVLGGYLTVGAVFGIASQPQQLWSCPDLEHPQGAAHSGQMRYADEQGESCTGTVTLHERATTFAVGAALWLPLVVASGLTS